MTEQGFRDLTAQGVVLLDGATGSNLMRMGMPKGVCTEQWLYERPQVQAELQRGYIEAGTQIIYAPTFQANRFAFANFGLENSLKEYNQVLLGRTKEIAENRALVAGDIASTGKYEESYDTYLEVFKEQIQYLAQGGADLLVAETMIQMEETMAVLDAAKNVCDLPVICTMTVEADGSLLMGGNIFEAVAAYEAMGASAVGINCSLGPDQLESIVKGIRQRVSVPVVVKPNAGIPYINDRGEAVYSMGAEEFADHMVKLINAGADLIGGCCGTDAEYIRVLKERIR